MKISKIPKLSSFDLRRQKTDSLEWFKSGTVSMIAAVSQLEAIAHNVDFSSLPSEFVDRFQSVGTRDSWRDIEEARLIFEDVPAPIRAEGMDAVNEFRNGKDWSHIISHQHGGADSAGNGLFEVEALNRSRGSEDMSWWAEDKAQVSNFLEGSESYLQQAAEQALTAGAAVAAVSAAMALLEFGLQYAKGEIDKEQFYRNLIKTVGRDISRTIVIVCLISSLATVFPPSAAVLLIVAKPLAVIGLAALSVRFGKLGFDWYVFLEETDFLGKLDDEWFKLGIKMGVKKDLLISNLRKAP